VPEVAGAVGGAGRHSTDDGGGRVFGAGTDVGGRPTTAAELDGESSVDVDVYAAGWWGEKDAPPGTLAEHYRMGLPWPSSSYPPCEHG
jgi:hypothetical protein